PTPRHRPRLLDCGTISVHTFSRTGLILPHAPGVKTPPDRSRQTGRTRRREPRARHIAADADGGALSGALSPSAILCMLGPCAARLPWVPSPDLDIVCSTARRVFAAPGIPSSACGRTPLWLPRAPIAPPTSHFAPPPLASPSRSSATLSRSRIC